MRTHDHRFCREATADQGAVVLFHGPGPAARLIRPRPRFARSGLRVQWLVKRLCLARRRLISHQAGLILLLPMTWRTIARDGAARRALGGGGGGAVTVLLTLCPRDTTTIPTTI